MVVGSALAQLAVHLGADRGSAAAVLEMALLPGLWTVYLLPALRRVYPQSWGASALRCAGLLVALVVVLQLYRLVLFFAAFYATGPAAA